MHEDAGKQENSADCERDGAFCEDDAAQGSCFFKAPIRDEERDENERHGSEIVVNERAARHEYPRQIRGQEADDTDERGAGVPFTALTNAYTVAGTHAQKNSGLPSTEMVRMWPSLSAL